MNVSNHMRDIYSCSWWTLKVTYGLLFIIAGADKFFNMITNWEQYLNPKLPEMLSISNIQFMHGVGIIEIAIGLITLTFLTRLGAYLSTAWLLLIIVNLLSMMHFYDIAIRDAVMAIGAFVLGQLTYIKERAEHK